MATLLSAIKSKNVKHITEQIAVCPPTSLHITAAINSNTREILQNIICAAKNVNIEEYTPLIFTKNTFIFETFILAAAVKSVKGLESVYCRYASSAHYSCMEKHQICFDRQQALKYTMLYTKYSSFQYLLKGVRYTEQLNYQYLCPDKSTHTLLSLCAVNGYLQGIQHLLKDGADISGLTVNSKGETQNILMSICDNPALVQSPSFIAQIKCAMYILDRKLIEVNQTNTQGQSALMFAYRAKSKALAELLISYGANTCITDMREMQAADYQETL